MKLQRLRAVKPFVASFPCAAGDADFIQNELTEDEKGHVVTKRVPYKRVVGRIDTERPASDADKREDAERKRIAEMLNQPHVSKLDGDNIKVPADPPWVEVPPALAENLVMRGLAEFIDEPEPEHLPTPAPRIAGTRRMPAAQAR